MRYSGLGVHSVSFSGSCWRFLGYIASITPLYPRYTQVIFQMPSLIASHSWIIQMISLFGRKQSCNQPALDSNYTPWKSKRLQPNNCSSVLCFLVPINPFFSNSMLVLFVSFLFFFGGVRGWMISSLGGYIHKFKMKPKLDDFQTENLLIWGCHFQVPYFFGGEKNMCSIFPCFLGERICFQKNANVSGTNEICSGVSMEVNSQLVSWFISPIYGTYNLVI